MRNIHCDIKPLSRKNGRSATATSAYRNREKIADERTGLVHDFSKHKQDVIAKSCFMFMGDTKVALNKSDVWNKAETCEKAKNARTARDYIINLPAELDQQRQIKIVDSIGEMLSKKYGVAVDYAIHQPDEEGDNRNVHVHLLTTTRKAFFNDFGKFDLGDKTDFELSNKDLKLKNELTTDQQMTQVRKMVADTINEQLAEAGLDIRYTHLSYEKQGITKIPTIKLGWKSSQLEREGKRTRRGDYNRLVKEANDIGWSEGFDKFIDKKIQDLEFEIKVGKGKLEARQLFAQRPATTSPAPAPQEHERIEAHALVQQGRKAWQDQQEQAKRAEALSMIEQGRQAFKIQQEAERKAEQERQARQAEADRLKELERQARQAEQERQLELERLRQVQQLARNPTAPDPEPDNNRNDDTGFTP